MEIVVECSKSSQISGGGSNNNKRTEGTWWKSNRRTCSMSRPFKSISTENSWRNKNLKGWEIWKLLPNKLISNKWNKKSTRKVLIEIWEPLKKLIILTISRGTISSPKILYFLVYLGNLSVHAQQKQGLTLSLEGNERGSKETDSWGAGEAEDWEESAEWSWGRRGQTVRPANVSPAKGHRGSGQAQKQRTSGRQEGHGRVQQVESPRDEEESLQCL